jgi:hypothetical protein
VFHTYFYWGVLIFKWLTARRLYKSFGVKGLTWRACNLTAQSIQWMFRNGAVGMRFRYATGDFLFETCWMALSVHRLSDAYHQRFLFTEAWNTSTSAVVSIVPTAILSNVFPLLHILTKTETSRKIRDAGTCNLSVCCNENLRSHTRTTTHRFCVIGTLQSAMYTDIARLAAVHYCVLCKPFNLVS